MHPLYDCAEMQPRNGIWQRRKEPVCLRELQKLCNFLSCLVNIVRAAMGHYKANAQAAVIQKLGTIHRHCPRR
jgi:hypothetical protein